METGTVEAHIIRHINRLNEPYSLYERFFDGLLVKKAEHEALLQDLKSFRQQHTIILLLQQRNSEAYRQCTYEFLASRFSHPWIKISPLQRDWFRQEWEPTKQLPKSFKRDVEQLHRLLFPIWCQMRLRMFDVLPPDPTRSEEQFVTLSVQPKLAMQPKVNSPQEQPPSKISEPKAGSSRPRSPPDVSPARNPDYSDKAEATAIANLFVGIAAAGMLADLPKWKLKRLARRF